MVGSLYKMVWSEAAFSAVQTLCTVSQPDREVSILSDAEYMFNIINVLLLVPHSFVVILSTWRSFIPHSFILALLLLPTRFRANGLIRQFAFRFMTRVSMLLVKVLVLVVRVCAINVEGL